MYRNNRLHHWLRNDHDQTLHVVSLVLPRFSLWHSSPRPIIPLKNPPPPTQSSTHPTNIAPPP